MPTLPAPFDPGQPPIFGGLPDLPAIEELKTHRQWVAWRWKHVPGRPKPTKPPVNPHSGFGASHSNPATWGSYAEAEARAINDKLPGVGFVIAADDPYTGADLDDCRDPETGVIEAWANDILAFAETYAEISPSGTGIRMIWRGKIPATVKSDQAHVELYNSLRYLTITGRHIAGTPESINEAPKSEAALRARIDTFRPPEPPPHAPIGSDYFRTVNDRALANLSAWVPTMFGAAAKFQFSTSAYRVSSKALGRDLEEDLSISPKGIKDWGVHDRGDARQGRRTPIDLALEYGIAQNVVDAAHWLATRLGATPAALGWQSTAGDPIAAESQRNLAAKLQPPKSPAIDTSPLEDLRFPSSPYTPEAIGGVLGLTTQHILSTALFPVPDFACLAALIFGSALYGRRWSEPLMGGGLNLYAIATAPTGWGKDHPLQEPRQLAYRCEMMSLVGPGEFKSDSAIEKTLRKCPIRMCFMDEIGIVLQANAAKNANTWERRVRKALLECYSASRGMYTGSQAAGDEGDKGSEPIHRPVLSIYGTSTPEELYKGLSEANIQDGLFGRLIFASPDARPVRQVPGQGHYDELRALADAVRSYVPANTKQPSIYHVALRNALMAPPQIRVPISENARAALEMIQDWQRDLTEAETDLARIANRTGENCGKLATLRALSRDHENPEVTYEDAQWAWSIVERSLAVITRDIELHMVGSEFEGLVKAILFHVREAKGSMTFRDLRRRRGVSSAHARDLNAALKLLQETGEIVMDRTNNRGFRIRSGG